MINRPNCRSQSRGFTLIEALVALVIVAGGLLALLRFQTTLFSQAAVSKQTSEATMLAQQRMEELRVYASQAGYDSLAALGTSSETISGESASYTRSTTVTSHTTPSVYSDVLVTVSWTTSNGETRSVNLSSAVAWNDPASAGILITGTSLSCPAQTVTDGLCSGTSVAADNGASQTITYSGANGTGNGVWLCTNGALAKTSGTCQAKCASATVADASCQGTAAASIEGDTVTVTYSSGGTGSGTFLCGSNGAFTRQSGSCDPSCALPWGATLADGGSVKAYKATNPSVACDDTNNVTTLVCSAGRLSGDTTIFNQSSCNEPCFGTPWGTMVHGATQTGYLVPSSTSCLSNKQDRTCNNGTLSGTATYTSCTPLGTADCTTPWGDSVAHLGSVFAYENQSSDPTICSRRETRTCSNGVLSGSYQYKTDKCPCTVKVISNVDAGDGPWYLNQFSYSRTPSPGSWISSPSCTPSPDGSTTKTITCEGKLSLGGSVSTKPNSAQLKNSGTLKGTDISCTRDSVTCSASNTQLNVTCTVSKD